MTRPTAQQLAEWRAHAGVWAKADPSRVGGASNARVLAQRLLALLDLLDEPAPVVQCPSRPKVTGKVLPCEPNRLARGRCIWCHTPMGIAK